MKFLNSILLLLLILSCKKNVFEHNNFIDIPNNFPVPVIPESNQLNQDRINLGKMLFYDPILSIDSSISCNSCHKQEFAFSDNKSISPGVKSRLGSRNTMSLANVVYYDAFQREGGVKSLEMQVLVPIEDHNEMGFNIILASEKMLLHDKYVELSQIAYNRNPDPYVITRSIASFERTLISGNSDFDKNNLTLDQKNGKNLFFGNRLKCSECHSGFLFTNQNFENNGLYEIYNDSGRYSLTNQVKDIGKFKVPSLRNIELTEPYMHDGSILTLEDVINHYSKGGNYHINKSEHITGFKISQKEKEDLIKFLKSLTDYEFISNNELKNF